MSYKDKTFCSSNYCKNACGHKMTLEEIKEVTKLRCDICWATFCDIEGNLIYGSASSSSVESTS